jgi:hypothetical protein
MRPTSAPEAGWSSPSSQAVLLLPASLLPVEPLSLVWIPGVAIFLALTALAVVALPSVGRAGHVATDAPPHAPACVLVFFFNTVILALAVNLLASSIERALLETRPR